MLWLVVNKVYEDLGSRAYSRDNKTLTTQKFTIIACLLLLFTDPLYIALAPSDLPIHVCLSLFPFSVLASILFVTMPSSCASESPHHPHLHMLWSFSHLSPTHSLLHCSPISFFFSYLHSPFTTIFLFQNTSFGMLGNVV